MPNLPRSKYFISLVFCWFCILEVNAQIQFAQPIPQPFGLQEFPDGTDSAVVRYQFMDIDDDGDQDCRLTVSLVASEAWQNYTHCGLQNGNGSGAAFDQIMLDDTCMLDYITELSSLNYTHNFPLTFADLDEDGDMDAYLFDAEDQGYWGIYWGFTAFENQENSSSFEDNINYNPVDQVSFLVNHVDDHFQGITNWEFADINRDGKDDLINHYFDIDLTSDTISYTSKAIIHLNNGMAGVFPFEDDSGTFGEPVFDSLFSSLDMDESFSGMQVIGYPDIDGDGDRDPVIALNCRTHNDDWDQLAKLYVAENTGAGRFEFANGWTEIYRDTTRWGVFVDDYIFIDFIPEDLDGDGDTDFLINKEYFTEVENNQVNISNRLLYLENLTLLPSRVDDQTFNVLSLYPNPSSSTVHVKFSNPGKMPATLYLFDVNGVELEIHQSRSNHLYFELDRIPAGIYFVSMDLNNQITTQKLIITP